MTERTLTPGAVLRDIGRYPESTCQEIAARLGHPARRVTAELDVLKRDKKVTWTGNTRGVRYRRARK